MPEMERTTPGALTVGEPAGSLGDSDRLLREPMTQSSSDPTRPASSTSDDVPKLTVSPIQVIASALASVSAAIVASLFNVAGTIVGTVLVSVFATLGAAVYSTSIRRAHARLRQATRQRPPLPSTQARPYPPPRGDKEIPTGLAGLAKLGDTERGSRSMHRRPPPRNWRNIRVPVVGAIVAVLVIAVVSLTVIELVAQKPLSAVVRGQSGSGQTFFGGGSGKPSTTTTSTTSTTSPAATTPTTTRQSPATSSPSTTTTTAPQSTTTTTSGARPSGAVPDPTTTTTAK